VSAAISCEVNTLNSENILRSGVYLFEGEKFFDQRTWQRVKKYDPVFARLWEGPVDMAFSLRPQIALDLKGRLLYNGRLYNKDTWTSFFTTQDELYGPPKVIRQQGRLAKEEFDVRNQHPDVVIFDDAGKPYHSDHCECGGQLVLDNNLNLYCVKCKLIYE
jgi:hypothetical protein